MSATSSQPAASPVSAVKTLGALVLLLLVIFAVVTVISCVAEFAAYEVGGGEFPAFESYSFNG